MTGVRRVDALATVNASDDVEVTVDEDRPRDALLAELSTLRVENARLRGLLGLDSRGDDGHEVAWSPTLLSESDISDVADVSSPTAAKGLRCCGDCSGPARTCTPRVGRAHRPASQVGNRPRRVAGRRAAHRATSFRSPTPCSRRILLVARRWESSAAPRRPVRSAGLRLRSGLVGARRTRIPRRLSHERCSRRIGAIPLWQRGTRVGVLRRVGAGCRRASDGSGIAAAGDDGPGRVGPGELRPVLPVSGLSAQSRVREPDRPATAG